MSILYILPGLTLLVVGANYLVRSSVALSFRLNLSKMVIGLTVVSFATSAPELFVSVQAALDGHSSISLGNVIGSNIANIGLVLGITAFITPLAIEKADKFYWHWLVMMLFSAAVYILLYGKKINVTDGILLIVMLIIYLWILINRTRKKAGMETIEEVNDALANVSNFKIIFWLLIGGGALWGGSVLLVAGAVDLARAMEVSERAIAVTVIAVGTSVPELAASIIAALKKEKAISLGNVIGSNIFNIASVLGITAIISPIEVKDPAILNNDIWWMLGFAAVLLPLAYLPKKYSIGRYKGLLILVAYLVFVTLTFL